MSWRRGLLRLWLLISAIWIGLVAWIAYYNAVVPRQAAAAYNACFEARKADSTLGNPFGCFDGASPFADLVPWSSDIIKYGTWAFAPVIATLVLGFSIAWVLAGFRRV
jgi:hypothetical protein